MAEQALADLAQAPDILPATFPKTPLDRLPWIKADLADLADRIPGQGDAEEAVAALIEKMIAEAKTNDPRIPAEHRTRKK